MTGGSQPLEGRGTLHNGKPTFFVDEAVFPMIYAWTDSPGGRWSWEQCKSKHTGHM